MKKLWVLNTLTLVSASLISAHALADAIAAAPAQNAFSFCEAAMKQLPIIKQDNKIEGRNVLDFVHFTADGKVEANVDSSVLQSSTNGDGSMGYMQLGIDPRHCTTKEKILRTCKELDQPRKEDVYFHYDPNGKIKNVVVQHFEDGAWRNSQVTFLPSDDGSKCYVQHVNSYLKNDTTGMNISSIEFDLEACKLAHDADNRTERKAVLKFEGINKYSACKTPFAKAAMAQYYRDNPNRDASYTATASVPVATAPVASALVAPTDMTASQPQ
jgi:hypothetical protein